jgi:hypothetical protein
VGYLNISAIFEATELKSNIVTINRIVVKFVVKRICRSDGASVLSDGHDVGVTGLQ